MTPQLQTPEILQERELRGIWYKMLRRCNNPKDVSYRNYGARGITVCARWKKYENFKKDMGYRPDKTYSIDRIDNDGGYKKSNCRWATKTEQNRNTRANVNLTYKGKTQCGSAWAEELGIDPASFFERLEKGYSIERLFSDQKLGNYKPLTLNGVTKSRNQWAIDLGLSGSLITQREKRGLPVEKILCPKRRGKIKKPKAVREFVESRGK